MVDPRHHEIAREHHRKSKEESHHHRRHHDPEVERVFRHHRRSHHEVDPEDVSPLRTNKIHRGRHTRIHHPPRQDSDESPEEESPSRRFVLRPNPHHHRSKEHHEEEHRSSPLRKQLYLSATDLRGLHHKHCPQRERQNFKIQHRDPRFYGENSFNIDNKSQSDHDNILSRHRSHLQQHKDFDIKESFRRYLDIPDRVTDHHSGFRGEFGDGYFPDKRDQNKEIFPRELCLDNKHCCSRPDNYNNHLTSCRSCKLTSQLDDPTDKVIEKLKSEFIIAPKPSRYLTEKNLERDSKGVYVYVPLPEEDNPKRIERHLDSIYKNLYSTGDREDKGRRRKSELKRIIEKYSYPESYQESASTSHRTEDKILIDTFFKRCEQAGVQPRTTFSIDSKKSVSDILDDLCRVSPRESDSEFFAKFENKLRKALRTEEENCICHRSQQRDQLDPYIGDLVSALKGR